MKKILGFLEKYWLVFFLVLITLGFLLRALIPFDVTSFTYDQARDAQRIYDMFSLHHLKLVGPETDIPGVFNGPLLYYLLLPIYALFGFNPIAAVIFFMCINLLIGALLFFFGKVILKNSSIGLLSLLFWIFSFDQLSFAHYISNASLMGLGATLFFLGLAFYFLRNKNFGLPLSVLGLAVSIHANFYLVYLVIFYGIFFYLYPLKHSLKLIGANSALLLLLLSPFFIAELKWHFMMTNSMLSYMSHQGNLNTFSSSVISYMDKMAEAMYSSFFSFNVFLGFLIILGIILFGYKYGKNKRDIVFLSVWALSTFPLFGFSSGVLTTSVVNLTILPAVTLLVAYGVIELFQQKRYAILGILFVALLILGNMKLLVASDFTRNTVLMSYQSEKGVIDYTYQKAHGRPFSICAVTNPLFINTVWSYLYDHYGLTTYHYLPFWSGPQQYTNVNNLPYDVDHTPLRFIITQSYGVPNYALETTLYAEDQTSVLLGTREFGEFAVEERKLQANPHRFIDTQNLSVSQATQAAMLLHTTPLYSCYNTYTQTQ